MKIDEVKKLLESQQADVKDLAAVNDLIDKVMDGEGEPETEPEGEPEGEPDAEPEGEPTPEPEGEPEGEPDGEPEGENTVNLSAVLEEIVSLRTQVATLTERLAVSESALAAKTKAESEFIEKFKNLSVSIREEQKPVVTQKKIGMTNGIGEL